MYLLYVDNEFISSADIKEMVDQSTEETDIINCFSTATLLKLAEKLSPEIIIIDFELVKDRLSELFSDLREKSYSSHVLALIDPDNYDKLYKAIEAGAVDDYIVKPIRKEEFLARVRIAAKKEKESGKKEESTDQHLGGGLLLDFDRHKSKPQEEQTEPEDQLIDSDDFTETETDHEPGGPVIDEFREDEPTLEAEPEDEESYNFDDIMPEESSEQAGEGAAEPDLTPGAESASEDDVGLELFDDFPEAEDQFEAVDEESLPGEEATSGEAEAEQFFDEPLAEDPFVDSANAKSTDVESLSESPVKSDDDIKDLDDLFEDQFQEDQPQEDLLEEKLDPLFSEETAAEKQDLPFVKPAADFLDDVTLTGPESAEPASFPEPVKPAEEDLFAEPAFGSDFDDLNEPSFDSPVAEEPSFEPVSDTDDDQYFDSLFDDEPEGSADAAAFDIPEATPAQPAGRKSLREISELPGETADDFLFGDSDEFDEEHDKARLDELIEEGTFGAKKKKDKQDEGKDKKRGGGFSKFFSILGNVIFVLLLLVMATLSFFLIQSRIAGGVPEVAGYRMYIVLSGSMSPEFDTGSLAFVQDVDTDELAIGDIITYRSQADSDSLTTHRIVEVQRNDSLQFVTRGDANNVNDPNPVLAENIVGQVTGSVPYVGYALNFVQTRQGLILLIFVPGILIIVYELSKIMKYLTRGNTGKGKESDDSSDTQPA